MIEVNFKRSIQFVFLLFQFLKNLVMLINQLLNTCSVKLQSSIFINP